MHAAPPAYFQEFQLAKVVRLLSREKVDRLPERAREVAEYRKCGLSFNQRHRLDSPVLRDGWAPHE